MREDEATMVNSIPRGADDLDELVREIHRQTTEVEEIVGGLSPDKLDWRPSPAKWSVGGHIAHMVLVNGPYLEAIAGSLSRARERGRVGDGPYRHPWFGRWFAGSMEPPPKRRWKTAPKMVPDPLVAADDVLASFRGCQGELARLVEASRGVDLGRARLSSPFMKILRFSVGATFGILLAHNRRHIWLIRELLTQGGVFGTEDAG
jgi:hypothetical protein